MAIETSAAEAATTTESQQDLSNQAVNEAFTSALSGLEDFKYVKEKETTVAETEKEATAETKEPPTEEKVEEKTTEESETQEESTEESATEESVSKDPKAQAKWSELKKTVKQLKAETEKLKAEAAAATEAKEQLERIKSEHEALKKEREDIDKELYLSRVEATREYKQSVTEPLQRTFQQVEMLANQYKINPDQLVDALHKDVQGDASALDDILVEVPERHRNKIYTLSENLLQIENRRAELKDNAKQAFQSSLERENADREAYMSKMAESRTKELNNITSKFQEKFAPILKDAKFDYDAIKRDTMQIENWDEQTKMYSGVAAVVLPELVKAHESALAELKAIKAENVKLRGGSPKTSSGHSPSSPKEAEPKRDYSKMTMDDFAKESANRIASGIR